MAGLGTGAAPFRAFLQYRAQLAAQGVPVGPTYYYFGSRHQSQEYLYGEEIEAFVLDGTIARAGLAFSRDGPRKVYIQHKMREDGADLARMLCRRRACFICVGRRGLCRTCMRPLWRRWAPMPGWIGRRRGRSWRG